MPYASRMVFRQSLALLASLVLSLAGCSTTNKNLCMDQTRSRIVTATYRVSTERQAEFVELLQRCESTLREEGLVTGRSFLRMRSLEDPEALIELFEWVDEEAFGRAQENPRVLAWWGQFEEVWKEGGFGVSAIPESNMPWAQYQPIGE